MTYEHEPEVRLETLTLVASWDYVQRNESFLCSWTKLNVSGLIDVAAIFKGLVSEYKAMVL